MDTTHLPTGTFPSFETLEWAKSAESVGLLLAQLLLSNLVAHLPTCPCGTIPIAVPRSPYSYRSVTYSIGPRLTPAVKYLIWANIGAFVLQSIISDLIRVAGLTPAAVFQRFWIWQVVTYLFLHADPFHLLLNMLTLWMFGCELERLWGTRGFVRYYFITGIGAAFTTLAASWLPFDFGTMIYLSTTVGASGAIYGLLLAYGLFFADRPIYMYFLFPIPAKWFVIITGALVLWASVTDRMGGTAHLAHLGGMVIGYFYLTRGRGGPWAELKYRYTKWRMNRLRRRFDVHHGGRGSRPGSGWTH
jgi:membrane associated rhomboid family serine protease